MYEVMARRYRPSTFDEVVGQEHVAATLKNAISRNRVAHAYLFTGGHGCGKTTMARLLAKSLVCEKGPTPDPCGVCPLCRDVALGRDTDVLEIDGASNNGVEQIRQLREQAAYVPTRARFKIYIIDEAHMLSDSAFNALLKTLEEPPPHVKFILATTDPHKLPDTILSRCQRFDFRLVAPGALADFFKKLAKAENAEIEDAALEAVAAFAEGSVRDGLVLLDQLLSFADGKITRTDVESIRGAAGAEQVAGMFEAFVDANPVRALAIVDEAAARGANVGDFIDQLISFGRDLMVLAVTGKWEGISAYGPAREALGKLKDHVNIDTTLLYLDVLSQARVRVRTRALTNPLVALEMAVARLAGMGSLASVSDLMRRVDALSKGAPLPSLALALASENSAPPLNETSPREAGEPEQQAQPMPSHQPAVAELPPIPEPQATASDSGIDTADKENSYTDEAEDDFSDGNDSLSSAIPTMQPMTMETVRQAWPRIVDAMRASHPRDARYLTGVGVGEVRSDVIGLSGGALTLEAWDDEHRLARLSAEASNILGRPVSFRTMAAPVRPEGKNRDTDKSRQQAARHPGVEKVRDLFNGVIFDVQPPEA